jgi:hypothetical protein
MQARSRTSAKHAGNGRLGGQGSPCIADAGTRMKEERLAVSDQKQRAILPEDSSNKSTRSMPSITFELS